MDWNKGRTANFGEIINYEHTQKEVKRLEEKDDKRYEEDMELQRGFLKAAQEKNKSIDRLASAVENLASSISKLCKDK